MKKLSLFLCVLLTACSANPDWSPPTGAPYVEDTPKLPSMSDPGAPSYTVPNFAPATNYPAGADPWSAQPMKTTPADEYFTPGRTEPAEEMNFILHRQDVAQAAAKTYVGSLRTWVNNKKLVEHFSYGDSDDSDALTSLATFATTGYTGGTLISPGLTLVAGDVVQIAFSGCYKITNGTGGALTSTVKLMYGTVPTNVPGGAKWVLKTVDPAPIVSATMHGQWIQASDTNLISLVGKVSATTGGSQIELVGPFDIQIHVYRTTP